MHASAGLRIALVAIAPAVGLACTDSGFVCHEDGECGNDGTCQLTGACSFPDSACPSGQRYGEHARPGLANECVDEVEGTSTAGETLASDATLTSSSGSGPTTTSTTTSDGTTTTTTGVGSSTSSTTGTTSTSTSTSTTASSETSSSTSDAEGSSSSDTTGEQGDANLLLWLEFEQAGGGSVPDSSIYGATAACSPSTCPTIEPGAVGLQAGLFDGLDDALQVDTAERFEVTDGLTLMAWVRIEGLGGETRRSIVGKAYGDEIRNSWQLLLVGSGDNLDDWGLALNMNSAALDTNLVIPVSFGLNTWANVAATYDGARGRIYINGEEILSRPFSPPIYDNHPIAVGHDINSGNLVGHFDGGIDDVRIYDRALSAGEIEMIAESGR